MGRKLRVGVLFGGRSGEHEVSLASGRSVIDALEASGKYDVVQIGVAATGEWIAGPAAHAELSNRAGFLLPGQTAGRAPSAGPDAATSRPAALLPGKGRTLVPLGGTADSGERLDVVFPVVHGPHGEDGTVQGLLELAGIPYVGCGVASSAACMDKDLAKHVLRSHDLPVVDWALVRAQQWQSDPDEVRARVDAVGYPSFVKPANLGSSVGIHMVAADADLAAALDDALRYDVKAIVERAIDAREIEVAVLGHDEPRASVPGEIVPSGEFYDYRAKYLEQERPSELRIPAPLDETTTEQVRELAVQAFRALDGSGMARVDFLLDRATNDLWINELNTIPGFTSISMYTKLWEATGLPYPDLLDELIRLAQERHKQRQNLTNHYSP